MPYYDVAVNNPKYQGTDTLTYSWPQNLKVGAIVEVPLRQQKSLGVVLRKTERPTFPSKQALRVLSSSLPPASLKLLEWLRSYYPAPISHHVSLFLPPALASSARATTPSATTTAPHRPHPLPPLTTEQTKAIVDIKKYLQVGRRTFMLHGRTGSGKTRLYIELAKQMLAQGRSVLILTPEIGLTSPLYTFFRTHLTDEVILMHSGLTGATRRNHWLKSMQKSPAVVIGPRSALFAPLSNIGLIAIDEAHDNAYKQDQAPRYQAVRVAGTLASIHSAMLILGSATPLVSDYYLMRAKGAPIIQLRELAAGKAAPPQIKVVSSRDRDQFTLHPYLSNELINAVTASLKKKHQSLLFLNRRGTAQLVFCQNCGWQALCPKCDIPMTYHGDSHHLQCHTCGYKMPAPAGCPECGSADILFKSAGTKAIETYARQLFPEATVGRFDTDNHRADSLEQSFEAVKSGGIDILVGTQMLAKGLDLPRLEVVGIVTADTGLYFPDYTAAEQTYQLLTQVIGRVNRGHLPGQVIIQTFLPDNPILQATINGSWQSFYEQQIQERKQYQFPPFCYVLKLTVARKTKASAAQASQKLAATLKAMSLQGTIIQGPTPRFIERAAGYYHQQIILKAKNRGELLKVIPKLPSGWQYDLDPAHLL